MPDIGQLRIQALWDGHLLSDVRVQCQRPDLSALWRGLPAAALPERVARLYSLCTRAQHAAAALAVAAATGHTAPELPSDQALWLEALHEHLWRLCLDWPKALGCPAAAVQSCTAAFVGWRQQALGANANALAATTQWSATHWPSLRENLLAAALPWPGVHGRLADKLMATEAAMSALQGDPVPACPKAQPPSASPLVGVGAVLTARGWLHHRVQVNAHDGAVAHLHIDAPTDRHFNGAQALMQVLSAAPMQDRAQAEQALHLAVLCLDPCLPYHLELINA